MDPMPTQLAAVSTVLAADLGHMVDFAYLTTPYSTWTPRVSDTFYGFDAVHPCERYDGPPS